MIPRAGLLLALLPAPLGAQAAPLQLEIAGRTTPVATVRSVHGVGLPLATLERLGARIETRLDRLRVDLFGDTLEFWIGSPFFTARRQVWPLAGPVTDAPGGPLLPAPFFTEWLPAAFPDRVVWSDRTLRVTGPIVLPEPEPARPPASDTRVVIIDPGHGGGDTGKIGPNGLREKDAALQLGRRLARILADRGYEVHLTRDKDTLVALDDRPRFANARKKGRPATLFLSLHMNSTATGRGPARGFETFFLSEARTEDERRVAEMENAAVQFEERTVGPITEEQIILNGLRNDFYVKASNDLAEAVQRAVAGVHSGPDRGVKRAGFRVLLGALMPAVLVEVGFISNAAEARLLAESTFQESVAKAIAEAVGRFFDGHEHLWRGSAP